MHFSLPWIIRGQVGVRSSRSSPEHHHIVVKLVVMKKEGGIMCHRHKHQNLPASITSRDMMLLKIHHLHHHLLHRIHVAGNLQVAYVATVNSQSLS